MEKKDNVRNENLITDIKEESRLLTHTNGHFAFPEKEGMQSGSGKRASQVIVESMPQGKNAYLSTEATGQQNSTHDERPKLEIGNREIENQQRELKVVLKGFRSELMSFLEEKYRRL